MKPLGVACNKKLVFWGVQVWFDQIQAQRTVQRHRIPIIWLETWPYKIVRGYRCHPSSHKACQALTGKTEGTYQCKLWRGKKSCNVRVGRLMTIDLPVSDLCWNVSWEWLWQDFLVQQLCAQHGGGNGSNWQSQTQPPASRQNAYTLQQCQFKLVCVIPCIWPVIHIKPTSRLLNCAYSGTSHTTSLGARSDICCNICKCGPISELRALTSLTSVWIL